MPTPIRPTSASCPPGTFSLTTVAVTGSRSVRPSRSTVTSKVWPARFWIACISSSAVKTGWSASARLQPGLLGRGSARDRADLWCELRPHSELPRFFRLAEDRIAHGDEAWCHRDGLLGTTPLDGELERSAAGRGDELVHVLPMADRPAIDGDDQITRLESRLGRGRAFGDTTDHGRPHRTAHRREHEHEDEGGQHEVHARAREDDEEARPQRLERDGLAGIVGQRAPAPFERILLAHHLHVAAHRNDRQAVLGFFAPPAKEHGTEADGEGLDR